MKYFIFLLLFAPLFLISCMTKQEALTKQDINAKVDSIVKTKLPDINRMAKEDLDYRTAIEVKVKADSILQVQTIDSSKVKKTK
jgi:hypothetical protein